VSIATVSRVLNISPKVKEQTRAKVLRATETLNYQPNAAARGLALNATTAIALVIPDISGCFFSEIIRGVGIEAGELSYQAIGWGKARRMAVIRKKLPERPDPQMSLFTLERYSYQVITTNMTEMTPEDVWEFYDGRAVVENRIHRGGQEPVPSIQDSLLGLHGQRLLLSDGDAGLRFDQLVSEAVAVGGVEKG